MFEITARAVPEAIDADGYRHAVLAITAAATGGIKVIGGGSFSNPFVIEVAEVFRKGSTVLTIFDNVVVYSCDGHCPRRCTV